MCVSSLLVCCPSMFLSLKRGKGFWEYISNSHKQNELKYCPGISYSTEGLPGLSFNSAYNMGRASVQSQTFEAEVGRQPLPVPSVGREHPAHWLEPIRRWARCEYVRRRARFWTTGFSVRKEGKWKAFFYFTFESHHDMSGFLISQHIYSFT